MLQVNLYSRGLRPWFVAEAYLNTDFQALPTSGLRVCNSSKLLIQALASPGSEMGEGVVVVLGGSTEGVVKGPSLPVHLQKEFALAS